MQITSLSSLQFLGFLPLALALFWLTPKVHRWKAALAISYAFGVFVSLAPGQNRFFVPLLAGTTLVAWLVARRLGAAPTDRARRGWLVGGLVAQFGLLVAYKYLGFLTETANGVGTLLGLDFGIPPLSWIQPVGLSFTTFMIASYLIETWRGRQDPQESLWRFALYVSFFGHVMAGPIDRPNKFLPQLDTDAHFDYDRLTLGLKYLLWGFFLKIVVADRLALAANAFFANPSDYSGGGALLGIYAYTMQIYCDFNGYSFIAMGVGKLFGLELMRNFEQPYLATDIQHFWRRWHISLTTWFRDYLYIPLGGNRVGRMRQDLNIMIVFVLSGLWHGASWTFVFWGALHGAYLVFGEHTRDVRTRAAEALGLTRVPRLYKFLQWFVVFNLVAFAWIFFRATSFQNAIDAITAVFSGAANVGTSGFRGGDSKFLTGMIPIIIVVELMARKWDGALNWVNRYPQWSRWAGYSFLLWAVVLLGLFGGAGFIYNAF